jgi:hypothetical protein
MGLPTSFMQEKIYINFICASNYVFFIIIKIIYIYFNISQTKPTCLSYTILIYFIYRVIRKSLRDFRPLRYCSRNGHAEWEHFNSARDTPLFCPHLQLLVMSTLGDAADVNLVIKFLLHTLHLCGRNLITGLTSSATPRVDISSTCKLRQKLECLPLCWHSPLRRDHPVYSNTEVGNPGGTYELPCMCKSLWIHYYMNIICTACSLILSFIKMAWWWSNDRKI